MLKTSSTRLGIQEMFSGCSQGVQLRVHLMEYLRMHLAITIEMHKKVHMRVALKGAL